MLRFLRTVALGIAVLVPGACDKDEPAAGASSPAADPAPGADENKEAQEDEADPPRGPVEENDPREVGPDPDAPHKSGRDAQHERCDVGECKQACKADGDRCRLSCPGGKCSQSGNGGNASLGCTRDCTQTCEGEGKCRATCTKGNCTQVCKSGDCSLSCFGGGCSQTCEAGTTCELECEGGRCTRSCDDAKSCDKK